jgi:hypothetical protein
VAAGKLLGREGVQPDEVVIVRQGQVTVKGSNLPGAPKNIHNCWSDLAVKILLIDHAIKSAVSAGSKRAAALVHPTPC